MQRIKVQWDTEFFDKRRRTQTSLIMQNVFFAKERRAAEKQIKSQTIDKSGTHMTSTLRWAWGLRQK